MKSIEELTAGRCMIDKRMFKKPLAESFTLTRLMSQDDAPNKVWVPDDEEIEDYISRYVGVKYERI